MCVHNTHLSFRCSPVPKRYFAGHSLPHRRCSPRPQMIFTATTTATAVRVRAVRARYLLIRLSSIWNDARVVVAFQCRSGVAQKKSSGWIDARLGKYTFIRSSEEFPFV